jgi:hypothetical protein
MPYPESCPQCGGAFRNTGTHFTARRNEVGRHVLLELGCQNTNRRYWWDFTTGASTEEGRPSLARRPSLATSVPAAAPAAAGSSNGVHRVETNGYVKVSTLELSPASDSTNGRDQEGGFELGGSPPSVTPAASGVTHAESAVTLVPTSVTARESSVTARESSVTRGEATVTAAESSVTAGGPSVTPRDSAVTPSGRSVGDGRTSVAPRGSDLSAGRASGAARESGVTAGTSGVTAGTSGGTAGASGVTAGASGVTAGTSGVTAGTSGVTAGQAGGTSRESNVTTGPAGHSGVTPMGLAVTRLESIVNTRLNALAGVEPHGEAHLNPKPEAPLDQPAESDSERSLATRIDLPGTPPGSSPSMRDAFVRQLQLDRLTLRQMRSWLMAEEARRAIEVAAGATEATYERLALILFGVELAQLVGKQSAVPASSGMSAEERLELQRDKARIRARLRRAASKAARQQGS